MTKPDPVQPIGEIDSGDHVHHGPSGEDWVVAFVRGGSLCACGWPESMAELSDCTLIKKATPAERMNLLADMAKSLGQRGAYARERLRLAAPPTAAGGDVLAVQAEPPTMEDAYAEGRKDEHADCVELIAWSYGKLHHMNFQRMEDALMLDRMKLLLEHGIHA